MRDAIKRIHQYVWNRHIEGSDQYDHSIDEEDALRLLDAYYSEVGNRNSTDQVYLGILLFERAFEHPDEQAEHFERARKIFEFYRRVTGEDDWPAVEDRLEDIKMFFEEQQAEAAPAVVEAPPEQPPRAVEPVVPVEPVEPAPPADTAAEAAVEEVVEEVAEEEVVPPEVFSAADEEARRVEESAEAHRKAREAFIADLEVVDGMQLVPAGTFLYGPENREVFLDTFYIDRLPVTNAEYMRFVRETGYRPPRYANDERFSGPDLPVVGISLADALQYAKWAGKELPTETQWEKAARGTDGRPYPWGNDPPGTSDACFGLDPAQGAPVAVARAPRNISPFGVQDVCGNVWEWTISPYAKDGEYRVVRGGSYNDPADYLMLHFRLEAHPKDKCEAVGFRCVKNIHG